MGLLPVPAPAREGPLTPSSTAVVVMWLLWFPDKGRISAFYSTGLHSAPGQIPAGPDAEKVSSAHFLGPAGC